MKKYKSTIILLMILVIILSSFSGCIDEDIDNDYPKISSWLAKKDEIISSGKSFDLVMTAWFTLEEAVQIKSNNPNAKLLAGLSINWIWANEEWMTFLETIASYGREYPLEIEESMYLKTPDGEKCAFGWASGEWGQEEIYAMDPRDLGWIELITSFYKNVLDQSQHDGITVDMVTEKQWWCPEAISDEEWLESTKKIMRSIQEYNTDDKLVIFNCGRNFSDIDEYSEFIDGYLMENFMGEQLKSTFDEGLYAADSNYIVIYAVDTDDTGEKDLNKMRLGLTLSMLNNNTYFAYDFGPRDHGQAWWFPEYDVNLGDPIGQYYKKDNAYWREFEKGFVVSSPYANVSIYFEEEHTDATTNIKSTSFTVEKGDGRIYIKEI